MTLSRKTNDNNNSSYTLYLYEIRLKEKDCFLYFYAQSEAEALTLAIDRGKMSEEDTYSIKEYLIAKGEIAPESLLELGAPKKRESFDNTKNSLAIAILELMLLSVLVILFLKSIKF